MSTKHPQHWQTRRLGEVVDILDSKRVPLNASERAERPGTVPYYGATGQVGWIDASIFDEELVLLGEDGAPFFDASRAVAYLINGPAWVNNHAHVLRGSSGLRNRFLLYQLNQVDYHPYVSGTTRAKLPQGPMREIPLVVPSLPEQDRIVAAIEAHFSRLDAAEQGLKRVQAKLKHARASVLKAAVEGRLVPSETALARAEGRRYEPASALLARVLVERRARWAERGERGKYKEPVAPETEGLPELPEGWALGTVDAVCANIVDCPHSTPERVPSGRLCARTTQFRPGFLDLSEPEFVTEATYYERISRLKPEPGDVLYSREGGILGIACAVPNGVELCLGQRMMLMRASGVIYSRYLMLVLNSSMTLSVVRRLISGSAAPHINVRDIRAFVVPLPPLAEQARIAAEVDRRLSVFDQVEALVDRSLTRCASLRQSILKRAFEGRLVPPSAEVTPE